jgi:hypothetical protein
MKIQTLFLALPLLFTLTGCPWDDKKTTDADSDAKQKAAHDSFMENQLKPSPPYNVLDYTKPAPNNTDKH